jgi:hypothetical protein
VSRTDKILRSFAAADLLVFLYLLELNVAVLLAPANPLKQQSMLQALGLMSVFLVSLVLVRGQVSGLPCSIASVSTAPFSRATSSSSTCCRS